MANYRIVTNGYYYKIQLWDSFGNIMYPEGYWGDYLDHSAYGVHAPTYKTLREAESKLEELEKVALDYKMKYGGDWKPV